MKIIFNSIMICLSIHFFSCDNKEQDVWKVYYFGGQSNMDGFGYNSELPDSLNGIIAQKISTIHNIPEKNITILVKDIYIENLYRSLGFLVFNKIDSISNQIIKLIK